LTGILIWLCPSCHYIKESWLTTIFKIHCRIQEAYKEDTDTSTPSLILEEEKKNLPTHNRQN
jgi:hypothetical protein